MTLRPATPSDWTAIAALLTAAGLPLDGAAEHLDGFVVAEMEGRLAGVAGLETHGQHGLLRSVAVAEGYRGRGLGRTLTEEVIARARARGLRSLTLLTTTAAEYFPRLGFRGMARAEVPAELMASAEFRGACPASAAVLTLAL